LERATKSGSALLPPAILAETRAQTFVRLIHAGAYAAAERLVPAIARQTAQLQDGGPASAEERDCLQGLRTLALHRKPARSSWPARLQARLGRARAYLGARRP
jgi:hypothetical protein